MSFSSLALVLSIRVSVYSVSLNTNGFEMGAKLRSGRAEAKVGSVTVGTSGKAIEVSDGTAGSAYAGASGVVGAVKVGRLRDVLQRRNERFRPLLQAIGVGLCLSDNAVGVGHGRPLDCVGN